MLAVVILTKFANGAWLSILIMSLLVPFFYCIHRHYMRCVPSSMRAGATGGRAGHVVLLVRDLDASTAEALGYVKSCRPDDLRGVVPGRDGEVPKRLRRQWRASPGGHAGLGRRCRPAGLTPGDPIVVAIAPRPGRRRRPRRPRDRAEGLVATCCAPRLVRLKARMLREGNVVVTDVPVVLKQVIPSAPGGSR